MTLIIAGIMALAAYLFRKTLFCIDYAGGRCMFNAKILGLDKMHDFHKRLRMAKDAIRKQESHD